MPMKMITPDSMCFRPPLISKGLRHRVISSVEGEGAFQATPDFKGIKTVIYMPMAKWVMFQATPDFKGIKTTIGFRFKGLLRFRPPLISKGLRLVDLRVSVDLRGFRPPLISKGLNPAAAAALAAGLGKCCVNEEKAVSGFRCQCFEFGRKLFAGNLGL